MFLEVTGKGNKYPVWTLCPLKDTLSFPLCISSSFFLLSSFFFSSFPLSHPNSTLIFSNLFPQIKKEKKKGKWKETDLEYKLASGKGGDPFSAHSSCSIHSERNLKAPQDLAFFRKGTTAYSQDFSCSFYYQKQNITTFSQCTIAY